MIVLMRVLTFKGFNEYKGKINIKINDEDLETILIPGKPMNMRQAP